MQLVVGGILVRELAPPAAAQCEAARDDVGLVEGAGVKVRDDDGDDAHAHVTALDAVRCNAASSSSSFSESTMTWKKRTPRSFSRWSSRRKGVCGGCPASSK